jgi:hypothetical protein
MMPLIIIEAATPRFATFRLSLRYSDIDAPFFMLIRCHC